MYEIFEILPATGTMALDDILLALRADTFLGVPRLESALTPSILRKKMEVRIAHEVYYERSHDGRYARMTG